MSSMITYLNATESHAITRYAVLRQNHLKKKSQVKAKKNPLTNYKKHDEYTTPNEAWNSIFKYLPKSKYKIWMPFYCDGACGEYVSSNLGYEVLHPKGKDFFKYKPSNEISFFTNQKTITSYFRLQPQLTNFHLKPENTDKKWILVDNPPFTLVAEIMKRCVELNMPFILLLPQNRLNTNYFQAFNDDIVKKNKNPVKILQPRKSYKFIKFIGGNYMGGAKRTKKTCNFYTYWYCWNIPEIYNIPTKVEISVI